MKSIYNVLIEKLTNKILTLSVKFGTKDRLNLAFSHFTGNFMTYNLKSLLLRTNHILFKKMKLVICNSISVDSISTDLLNEHWALSDWALRITAIILKDYAKINKHKTSISSLCYSSKKSPKFLTKHTVFKPLNITRDISLSKHSPKGLNHLSNIKI